jgi:hypothetical protein
MTARKINVAIVGLGCGAEFIPIYQRHPYANMYAICQRSRDKLDAVGEGFGVGRAPFPDARTSANWTCVGLLAHQWALQGGAPLRLPDFTL